MRTRMPLTRFLAYLGVLLIVGVLVRVTSGANPLPLLAVGAGMGVLINLYGPD